MDDLTSQVRAKSTEVGDAAVKVHVQNKTVGGEDSGEKLHTNKDWNKGWGNYGKP